MEGNAVALCACHSTHTRLLVSDMQKAFMHMSGYRAVSSAYFQLPKKT